jgi:Ion channel
LRDAGGIIGRIVHFPPRLLTLLNPRYTPSFALDLLVIPFNEGTTIGYGDLTPNTDLGRLAVAIYALLVCNVVGGLLEPARDYFESLCHASPAPTRTHSE